MDNHEPQSNQSLKEILNFSYNTLDEVQQFLQNLSLTLATRPDSAEHWPQGKEEPFAWFLQANKVASRPNTYKIIWGQGRTEGNEGAGSGQGFLEELKENDRIVMWARVRVSHFNLHLYVIYSLCEKYNHSLIYSSSLDGHAA
jgi:hypothetical protein